MKEKIKKLVLGVLVIILIFSGMFLISKLINQYQQQQIAKEQEYQNRLQTNLETVELLKKESEQLAKESDTKIQELNKKFESEFKNFRETESQVERESESTILQMQQEIEQQMQAFEQKIKELEEETPHPSIPDLSLIISQWNPVIVPIQCEFRYSNTNQIYQLLSGSGVVIVSDTLSYILTNEHILTDDEGYWAHSCDIKLSSGTFTIPNKDFSFSLSDSLDLAIINITNPNQHIKSLTHKFYPLCRKQPAIGDEVVILGYPGIGSQGTITATEGIISGYDGDYFITSAKVEQGNSGGATILLKENCFLGIPTFARVGQIESLARILNINVVLD